MRWWRRTGDPMCDETPVKYESVVPSLTGVREARRRGRVTAVWVSLSICLSWARVRATRQRHTTARAYVSGASSTEGVHPGQARGGHSAAPQLTGATWGHLGYGRRGHFRGVPLGSHGKKCSLLEQYTSKRAKNGEKGSLSDQKGGNSTSKKKKIEEIRRIKKVVLPDATRRFTGSQSWRIL